jgi:heme/copper-type cytochrome/quinol oxidase subunit 2
MKTMNEYGSIVPLFIALLLIFLSGLLIGILNLFLAPVMDTSNTINSLISKIWVFIPVVILIIIIFYAVVRGQRGGQI